MNSTRSFRWCCYLGATATVFVSFLFRSAPALTIDDFTAGPLEIVGANTTVEHTQTGLPTENVIGGSRFISFRSFGNSPSTLTIDNQAGTLTVGPGDC